MKSSFALLTTLLAIGFWNSLFSEAPGLNLTVREAAAPELIYHPVSTGSADAQKHFDTGLTYIFAFNHDLAYREFEKAAQSDPNLAMAYWGMALALGQNINQDITPEHEKQAFAHVQKALSLLAYASPVEQAYIRALANRYTDNPSGDLTSLRYKYRDAMKQAAAEYPEDLDLSCLYTESILDIDPWKYWTWDGKPKEGTMDVIGILQSVLVRNPFHIGANHYYIHAWEESHTPEEAIASAFRLTKAIPPAGHLLHMPCHIFVLCGYYQDAIDTSIKAIAADRAYIKEYGMGGEYPLHYLPHNIKILARAYMLSENYAKAMETAEELNQFVAPYYESMPHLLKALIIPMEINQYLHRWKELLALPAPPLSYPITDAYWHFSRALASMNLGDVDGFKKERELMLGAAQKIPHGEEIANNPASAVFELAEFVLSAAEAKHQGNTSEYITKLKQAADRQARLDYDEPPAWYFPIWGELGDALLADKQYKKAEEAYKKGLQDLQRNGRLLNGLSSCLKAQQRDWDAFWVEREAKGALLESR